MWGRHEEEEVKWQSVSKLNVFTSDYVDKGGPECGLDISQIAISNFKLVNIGFFIFFHQNSTKC